MENTKVLLEQLYKEHAPEKVEQIDALLEKYKGKEEQFYVSEKAKYAKKRSVTDSKKILEEAMARIAAQKKEDAPKAKVEEKKAEPKTEAPQPKSIKKKTPPSKKEMVGDVAEIQTTKEETKESADKKEAVVIDKQDEAKPEPEKAVIPPQEEKKETNKLEEAKARLAESKAQNKTRKKKSFLWMIILLLLVLLVIFLALYYSNYYNPYEKESSKEATKVEEVTPDIESSKIEETPNKEAINEQSDTTIKTTTQEEEEATQVEPVRSSAARLYLGDIPDKAIFVSCFSVKKEKAVQEALEQLKKLHLEAHYYWIPDIDPKGNKYFKVVVGPYKDMASTFPSLTKVQEQINMDAYVLKMK